MATVPPVPLAWSNLTHNRSRFALFLLGVSFAVVLMGIQLGILLALVDSNCRLIDKLNTDLVLVHPHRAAVLYRQGVSRRRLSQAEAVAGVKDVHPMYVDYTMTQLRNLDQAGAQRTIRCVGLDPKAGLLRDIAGLNDDNLGLLSVSGTALMDTLSKRRSAPKAPPSDDWTVIPRDAKRGETDGWIETVYGKIPGPKTPPSSGWPIETELNGRRLQLVGGFEFGSDFGADGTLLMSEPTFLRWVRSVVAPFTPEAFPDYGLIRLVDGADAKDVQRRMREELDASGDDRDVDVLTLSQLRWREVEFWLTMTPIGVAFGFGLILGFVVGFIICYQILASDVTDHYAEYATLRAIGYSNWQLSKVVLTQSLILAVGGFVPGILVTWVGYTVMGGLTGLPLDFTPIRLVALFTATVLMCVFSGWLALGKVKKVDPANVF